MTEKATLHIANAELVSNVNYKTLVPELPVSVFLTHWYGALRNRKLNWFAEKDKKSTPVNSLNFRYLEDNSEGSDLEISVSSLPNEYNSRFVPLSIGITHCSVEPLHGEIIVNTINKSLIYASSVQSAFRSLDIPLPKGIPEIYSLSQRVTDPSDLPASGLELLTPGVQSAVLGTLGISDKQKNIVYLDPEIRIAIDALIFAIKDRSIFLNEWSYEPGISYKKKLHKLGLWPYKFDEANDFNGVRTIRQRAMKLLTGERKKKLSKGDFHNALLDFYERKNVRSFFDQIPPLRTVVELSSKQFRYPTGTVLTFQDFQKRLSNLFPQLNMSMIPGDASVLQDIDDHPHNVIVTLQDGFQIGFFISHSSGLCEQHKQL